MRFEKQAQELLIQNLTPRGVVRYTSRGWYCLTDHDFILHTEFYKERHVITSRSIVMLMVR